MEQLQNTVTLRGSLLALPEFSHAHHGRRFYRFCLEVERLSGAVDLLPVVAGLEVLEQVDLTGGSMLRVEGQLRSHNFTDESGRHLMIFVYADSITAEEGPAINQVHLEGAVCREPTCRRTPLGRQICDMMLAVPRGCRRADYLPCILWGSTALEAGACHTRDTVCIEGRFQSRIYTKLTETGCEEHTAYEISALRADFPPEE